MRETKRRACGMPRVARDKSRTHRYWYPPPCERGLEHEEGISTGMRMMVHKPKSHVVCEHIPSDLDHVARRPDGAGRKGLECAAGVTLLGVSCGHILATKATRRVIVWTLAGVAAGKPTGVEDASAARRAPRRVVVVV